MKRNKIFMLGTALCACTLLAGCGGGGGGGSTPTPKPKILTSIVVTPTTSTYFVGDEFTKSSIGSFQAYYSDGSTVSVKEGYTSDPTLPYTFVNGDVANGKDFNFTYQGLSSSFHVNVKEKKTN